jgi:hypothetical protein
LVVVVVVVVVFVLVESIFMAVSAAGAAAAGAGAAAAGVSSFCVEQAASTSAAATKAIFFMGQSPYEYWIGTIETAPYTQSSDSDVRYGFWEGWSRPNGDERRATGVRTTATSDG